MTLFRSLAVLLLLSSGSATALDAQSSRRTPPTGLNLRVTEARYPLDLGSLTEVIDSLNVMRLEGPRAPRSQGLTTFRVEPHWRYQPNDEGCAIVDAAVEVEIEVTLPRWLGAPAAITSDREAWSRILDAVRGHEYEHRDITVDVAGELMDDLLLLRAGTCTGLRRAAENIVTLARARLDEEHGALDGR